MLDSLRFDNRFVRELPGDPSRERAPRAVHGSCFSLIHPEPVRAPRLLCQAPEVARLLGVEPGLASSEAFLQVLAGNTLLPGMEPFAACYGGHQFGSWAGQLGDGRAISLGEVSRPNGERWELQLKGAGLTPYSRGGDGRAVLRASLREFLASEALHHLGIPTTRALALVSTGEPVVRDPLYDGHPRAEPGAIVCRVARSFLRFGSFELFAARGELEPLSRLLDYTIEAHFPELASAADAPTRYTALFHEVCRRTAVLLAHWMRVGFVHGVMNTDNMSILGLTLDYGPFAFLDHYDPGFTPNTSDTGRYRFGNQPRIARWNLLQLAEALFPLQQSVQRLQQGLELFDDTFEAEQRRMFADKLGLVDAESAEERRDRSSLVEELFRILALIETDLTIFFRCLADVPVADEAESSGAAVLLPLLSAYYDVRALAGETRERTLAWLRRYLARVRAQGRPSAERRARMRAANPRYVLRNYQAQLAIDAAEHGDLAVLTELHDVLRRPYDDQPGRERFAEQRPEWARERVGCSRLSCSS